MKLAYSLRFRLTIFYLFIVLGPVLIMTIAMPYYYQTSIARETQILTEGTLTSLARNIETYLDDLDRLTIAPYLNEEVMRALKLKASQDYGDIDDYTKLIANRALNSTLPLSLQNTRKDILGTILVTLDGSVYVTSVSGATPVPDYPYAEQEWYQKAVDDAGKVYVLPMDQEKTGPVYNVDILKEYGVEVPMTWDQLLAACETIKTKSAEKVTCVHMGGADSWPVGQYYDFFSTPLAISPATNDAQALLDGTYDWTRYVVLSKNLLTLKEKGYLNKDALTAKYLDSAQALAEGKAAFGFYGPFLCEEALKTNPELNCGLMPIPALVEGDAPTFAGGELTTWGVWKDSKNIDAAKKLVAYYAKPENIVAVANSNRVPAGLTGVQVDAGYLTQYYTQYADLRTFTYFDRVYLPNGMWDVLCRAGQDVLAGGATPEQVTETIKQEFERLRAAQ